MGLRRDSSSEEGSESDAVSVKSKLSEQSFRMQKEANNQQGERCFTHVPKKQYIDSMRESIKKRMSLIQYNSDTRQYIGYPLDKINPQAHF